MKKITSLLFISALVLSLGISFAQAKENKPDNSIKQDIEEQRENIKNEREKVKNQIEALREITKQKMEGLKNEVREEKDAAKAKLKELRITSRENFLNSFDERIVNLNKLTERINEKIVKFEAANLDTTTAKNLITEAEAKITIAQGKMAEINAILAESTNKISAENKTKLQNLSKETGAILREAHLALKNAVTSLKELLQTKKETTTEAKDDAVTENDNS